MPEVPAVVQPTEQEVADTRQRELDVAAGYFSTDTRQPAVPALQPQPGKAGREVVVVRPNGHTAPAPVTALSADEVGAVRGRLSEDGWDGDPLVDELFTRWGSDTAMNLGFVQAFASVYPDVLSVFERFGLGDHPAVYEAGAIMGRDAVIYAGDPEPAIRGVSNMTDVQLNTAEVQAMSEDEYDDALEAMREKTSKAQGEGNSRKANRLYAEQQAFITARQGNTPIVGLGGRTA